MKGTTAAAVRMVFDGLQSGADGSWVLLALTYVLSPGRGDVCASQSITIIGG
jgi:hypothetical protein